MKVKDPVFFWMIGKPRAPRSNPVASFVYSEEPGGLKWLKVSPIIRETRLAWLFMRFCGPDTLYRRTSARFAYGGDLLPVNIYNLLQKHILTLQH